MTSDPYRLFELAPAAYVVFDRDGLIVAANRAFAHLVGLDVEDIVGRRTLPSLLSVGGRIYFETHLTPHLDLNDHVDEVALEVIHAAGHRTPVLLSANVHQVDEPRGGTVVRAILFEARERRRYENDLLETTRAAEAAERHANDLSRTLQQTLIPPKPPTIPGLQVEAAYRPAGDGREVGGDFYDLFNLAPRTWFVVLGDVSGKGIPAATVTAFIRHTVRDLAMVHPDPADVLRALDHELADQATERFCTIVALRLEDTDDGWVVRGSVGGHPLPVLGRSDGTVAHLGVPGSLVGILDDAVYHTFTHLLAEDEFVLLYTDGVTEAKQGRRQFGSDRLIEVVRAAANRPGHVTDAVVEASLRFQDGNANDDIAVLTLRPVLHSGAHRSSPMTARAHVP